MAFTSEQRNQFNEALLSAFPGVNDLRRLIRLKLDVNPNEIVPSSSDLRTAVLDLIVWAESRGRLDELIVGARSQNEGNPELKRFAEEWGEGGSTPGEAPTSAIKSLHQLRARVPDFIGRQAEIGQLVKALRRATRRGEAAIGGIRGMGGVGKTELAYAVAQRLTDMFPDAQLLIEMRGVSDNPNPMTPEQALQEVLRAFEPLAQLPDNLNELRSAYRTLLSGKRVLVLADNVRDEKQVEALLPPPGCALLLTTRQRFDLPGMETVDLPTLPPLEAEKLLLDIYPDIGSAAPRMAQLCGRLPLALRLSASICANSPISVEDYLKALENERERLTRLRTPNTSVEASLQLSYATLDLPAQQVLCQFSVFPASFDLDAAKAVMEVPQAEGQGATSDQRLLQELLDLLYHRSLLEWDRQTRRYSLHDLVRVFALERLDDVGGTNAVRMRHAVHYAGVAAHAGELYKKGGENLLLGLKLFDGERTHVDAGWSWAQEQAGSEFSGDRPIAAGIR